ncbi:unnamed protein product [Durusdinium trenchii]|uniref:J domain-containing protein n=1 Tax=Durusdinium trenchii TaxID=1381693 RepID=A0ABP0RL54_9DINO
MADDDLEKQVGFLKALPLFALSKGAACTTTTTTKEMAEKALPASLPEAARRAKIPTIKQKILERLKAQKVENASKPAPKPGAAPPPAQAQSGHIPPPAGQPPAPPPPPPPPSDVGDARVLRLDGVEICGDEPWFADASIRKRLRDSVTEAHKEQKILVGPPADEVVRICPEDGRVLGAGAVLRLGGAHLGGYGESDIAYAYRQLSRALHPDKNPDLDKAQAAFHRLSEASDELRQGLQEQRNALKLIVGVMGGTATEMMLERPQEALFAEASRLLCAVCGIVTEGEVSHVAQGRAQFKFQRSSRMFYSCHMQTLMSEWFEKTYLLDLYASAPIRTAYDCAPKCFRAQFLCLLNRAALAEAKRFNDCVRAGWPKIMQTFPEMGLWRELRQAIHARVWDTSGEPVPEIQEENPTEETKRSKSRKRSRSRSRRRNRDRDRGRGNRREDGTYEIDDGRRHRDDTNWYERNPISGRGKGPLAERERKRDLAWEARWTASEDDGPKPMRAQEEPEEEVGRDPREVIAVHPSGARACKWARKWRSAMAAILPSGIDATAPLTDTDVRKLGLLLWKDIAAWAQRSEISRYLGLFRADHQTSKTFGWDGKEMPSTRGLEPARVPPEWSFVPVTDLFLVVGEGLVGITTEGIFGDLPKGTGRTSLRECYKKREKEPKDAVDRNDSVEPP